MLGCNADAGTLRTLERHQRFLQRPGGRRAVAAIADVTWRETVLLAVLERLHRRMDDRRGAIDRRVDDAEIRRAGLDIEDGSLYPSLNRMLVKGWLAAEWGVSENNRKARFYRLTAEGRKQLARETDEFDRLVYAIQQVMRTV